MLNIQNNATTCKQWIFLAVCALACSGLLSIIVIFLRLPFISSFVPSAQYIFDNALVIHVNLSILVWMCSIISLLFIINLQNTNNWFSFLWVLSTLSMLLMFISAFVPNTEVIKSNYIPVLQNKLFLLGLSLFIVSVLINAVLAYMSNKQTSYLYVGQIGLVIILVSSFLCFVLAYNNMPTDIYHSDKNLFYEYLFWGAGHLLQFAFAQAMFLVYLIMLNSSASLASSNKILPLFINTILAVGAPFTYFVYTVDSAELVQFFTWHMRIAGAVLPCFLIILVYRNIKTLLNDKGNYLLHSFVLFIYGGVLGVLTIEGNVTIPAHYHGSVVGITIAFMNFIYWLLPKLNFQEVKNSSIKWQIYAYSLGHFLHITGLVWLGGYGALRKVADLPSISSMLARACFITGGAISVIGGMLFVIVVLLHLLKGKARTN
ncbi:Cytochrome C and Quinol oxidase polypeptide I family protein [Wolbachia endosymbiont of Armadillidium vulgare str. wVulC]|uniref:Cbb3-type cytochrome c oxidase subunit I n=1 Tax=Wolbachia endosymbiont of Armadillidium arcangelii TaxID=3158571 RepID=A0AAU7Q1P5_9RICK|nr:cbb3-type cytochrome c oxidase subunit I [Wolbachia endosymbiont of Armadillidium vulgare]KLT22961.1 Cytochrome C and Quinol oxidase polypeptide I family protein [Wolbachia endosymbiont of Armadillidium vulgare str. wVulC]